MKFSLRDLFLVTVIVALVLAWWVDRSRLAGELREYESIEMPNVGGMPGLSGPLKEWKKQAKKRADEWNKKTDAQRDQEAAQNEKEANELFEWERQQLDSITETPNSSAPAPSAPKKQNIDALIKLEKLTEIEEKFVPTRYHLELVKPVPLRQLLESDILPRLLAIGAKVKFQVVSAEATKEWDAKLGPSPAAVVGVSKGEFTSEDEIVFSVYFPSAAN
jgi:hypothetical protein